MALTSSNCTPPSTGLEPITGKKVLAIITKFNYVLSEIVRFVCNFTVFSRMIQNSFIDMESMFKLFEEDEEVPPQCLFFVFISFNLTIYFFMCR